MVFYRINNTDVDKEVYNKFIILCENNELNCNVATYKKNNNYYHYALVNIETLVVVLLKQILIK